MSNAILYKFSIVDHVVRAAITDGQNLTNDHSYVMHYS